MLLSGVELLRSNFDLFSSISLEVCGSAGETLKVSCTFPSIARATQGCPFLCRVQYPVLRDSNQKGLIKSSKYDYIFKNSKAKQHRYHMEPAEYETDLPEYTEGRFEGHVADFTAGTILCCYTSS